MCRIFFSDRDNALFDQLCQSEGCQQVDSEVSSQRKERLTDAGTTNHQVPGCVRKLLHLGPRYGLARIIESSATVMDINQLVAGHKD